MFSSAANIAWLLQIPSHTHTCTAKNTPKFSNTVAEFNGQNLNQKKILVLNTFHYKNFPLAECIDKQAYACYVKITKKKFSHTD